MNVLVSGDGDSIFVKEYIENVLLKKNVKVTLITDNLSNKKWIDFYCLHEVKVINKKITIPIVRKIPKLRAVINQALLVYQLKKIGKFDAIHIHFVSKSKSFFLPFLRRRTDNIILTYWGSDLLRRSTSEILEMRKYIDLADNITFSTKQLKLKFEEVYGHEFNDKLSIVKFGISNFISIDEITNNESSIDSKKALGLPIDKIIIVIGYNRNKNQQQLEILNQIKLIHKSIIEKVCIVFPMTYGPHDSTYEKKIKDICATLSCKTIFLYDYLYSKDIARLCRSTEIMIHGQTTDAFSATIQEFLYAGTVLLNAGWLNNEELESMGVDYIKFNKFEELSTIVSSLVLNLGSNAINLEDNKKRISDVSSWRTNTERWWTVLKNIYKNDN